MIWVSGPQQVRASNPGHGKRPRAAPQPGRPGLPPCGLPADHGRAVRDGRPEAGPSRRQHPV